MAGEGRGLMFPTQHGSRPVYSMEVPPAADARSGVGNGRPRALRMATGESTGRDRGQRLIAQIGHVQPFVNLDLATARPDIVEFKDACDRMHAHFQGSPDRWATIDVRELDPFTDRGRLRLRLHHRTSHDGGPQPKFFVQCQNDSESHGLEVIAAVPPGLHATHIESGAESTAQVRFDSGATQRIKLMATGTGVGGVIWWDTGELPPKERPSRTPLEQLRAGDAMVVQAFGLPHLSFDLSGGHPAIAEFKDMCDDMLDLPPPTADKR